MLWSAETSVECPQTHTLAAQRLASERQKDQQHYGSLTHHSGGNSVCARSNDRDDDDDSDADSRHE